MGRKRQAISPTEALLWAIVVCTVLQTALKFLVPFLRGMKDFDWSDLPSVAELREARGKSQASSDVDETVVDVDFTETRTPKEPEPQPTPAEAT